MVKVMEGQLYFMEVMVVVKEAEVLVTRSFVAFKTNISDLFDQPKFSLFDQFFGHC
jgi:hypothetical protein